MRFYEIDTTLRVALGDADREFEARLRYIGGPFQADIQSVEILWPDGQWLEAPWLLDVFENNDALYDALRDHTTGRLMEERRAAAALRSEPV